MKTQVITRKIQIKVDGKENLHTLYSWRDMIRKAANIVVAHKYCQDNIKDFVYIKDEIKEKFFVKDVIKDGKGMSETNTTYRLLSSLLKGKVPSKIFDGLNTQINKTYAKIDRKDIYIGKAQLRTYKNNIPMPFTKKVFESIKTLQKEILNKEGEQKIIDTYSMNFYGLPLEFFFGRDRSNNKVILKRCLSGEYQFCDSSIQIDDKKKKVFLLLSVKIPVKDVLLDSEKELIGILSLSTPIVAILDGKQVFEIGDKETYLYKRKQIQEGRRRLQKALKHNNGGKGRKAKLSRLNSLEKAEFNYIQTLLHTYSRQLINVALRNNCGVIKLLNPTKDEIDKIKSDQLEGNDFVFRNWGWSGLSNLIAYKANMAGIKLILPKDIEDSSLK